jgi:hypothetical protein
MAEVSRQTLRRGGIMAATGIVILAIGQASLTDPSPCQPSFPPDAEFASTGSGLWVVSESYYAAELARSARNSDDRRIICGASASRHERPRLVDPEFLRAPDVANKTMASAAN